MATTTIEWKHITCAPFLDMTFIILPMFFYLNIKLFFKNWNIKKRSHICNGNRSTFQKSNIHIKILNIQWTMDYWILITISSTPYKTHEHGFLAYNVINPRPIHGWGSEKKKKVIKIFF